MGPLHPRRIDPVDPVVFRMGSDEPDETDPAHIVEAHDKASATGRCVRLDDGRGGRAGGGGHRAEAASGG